MEGPSGPEVKAGAQGSARRARGRLRPSSLLRELPLPRSISRLPHYTEPPVPARAHTRPGAPRAGGSPGAACGCTVTMLSSHSLHTRPRALPRARSRTQGRCHALSHTARPGSHAVTRSLCPHTGTHTLTPAPARPDALSRPPAGRPARPRAPRDASPLLARRPGGPRPGQGLDLAASGGLTKGPRRPGGQPAPAAGAAGSWSPAPGPGRRGACRDRRARAPRPPASSARVVSAARSQPRPSVPEPTRPGPAVRPADPSPRRRVRLDLRAGVNCAGAPRSPRLGVQKRWPRAAAGLWGARAVAASVRAPQVGLRAGAGGTPTAGLGVRATERAGARGSSWVPAVLPIPSFATY